MKRVGIPRGLYYYKYSALWETFFKSLGADVILSENTNKKVLTNGSNACVSEACIPVKAYFGHVLELVGKVDFIFMPRFTSVAKKQYICPEVCGVSDMVRNSVRGLPKIIDPEINLRESVKNSWRAALYTGEFITGDRRRISKAYKEAVTQYRNKRQALKFADTEFGKSLGINGSAARKADDSAAKLTIAIIGHSYTVYDTFLNMELIKKLNKFGADVLTLDMLDYIVSKDRCRELDKQFFWDYGTRAYGGAIQLIQKGRVDGILALTSFGCGVDSFVDELVEDKIRCESDIPFMKLVLDEHSAEAGFLTRLEAFIDMIVRRRQNDIYISTSGKHVYNC
ncbi:MAG TPA: acyl-CoA dehydratase activase-related protein [Ruminiclostridium sp.]|nr:acyl-CoA dehydratase activase-related protein [Ruminiclostridium sp.]